MKIYDYIIAGCGCAGMIFAYLMNQSSLAEKKILIIDRELNTGSNKTLSFWEKDSRFYEQIVSKSWNKLKLEFPHHSLDLQLNEYRYKTIKGEDLCNFVIDDLKKNINIDFCIESIDKITEEKDKIEIITHSGRKYQSDYVFSSMPVDLLKISEDPSHHFFFQQFCGFYIQTPQEEFNQETATLMDFRLNQDNITRFCYILPFGPKEALIEITYFSPKMADHTSVRGELEQYIHSVLGFSDYQVTRSEQGIIPMTNFPFPLSEGKRLIYLGTAAGMVKPSTGYAFQRIVRHCENLIHQLEKEKKPVIRIGLWKKRFRVYDSTLLNIMENNKIPVVKIFYGLFTRNPASRIFKFLDEDTCFYEEMLLFFTVKIRVFLLSFFNSLKKHYTRRIS